MLPLILLEFPPVFAGFAGLALPPAKASKTFAAGNAGAGGMYKWQFSNRNVHLAKPDPKFFVRILFYPKPDPRKIKKPETRPESIKIDPTHPYERGDSIFIFKERVPIC